MKHKTAELEGALLDAAVAEALGKKYVEISSDGKRCWAGVNHQDQEGGFFAPGSRWDHGGPIIDKNWRLITEKLFDWFGTKWRDSIDGKPGDTLRWFMRAYVASKLGDEVELP